MKNLIFILLLFLLTGCAQQLVFERKQYNYPKLIRVILQKQKENKWQLP
jgi:type III secretory pathway lipoprotein EscJ